MKNKNLTAYKHYENFKWISKRRKFWNIQEKNNMNHIFNNEIIQLIEAYESINYRNCYFNEKIPAMKQLNEMKQYLSDWYLTKLNVYCGTYTRFVLDKNFEIQ